MKEPWSLTTKSGKTSKKAARTSEKQKRNEQNTDSERTKHRLRTHKNTDSERTKTPTQNEQKRRPKTQSELRTWSRVRTQSKKRGVWKPLKKYTRRFVKWNPSFWKTQPHRFADYRLCGFLHYTQIKGETKKLYKLYTNPTFNPASRWFIVRYEMYSLRLKLYTNYTQTIHWSVQNPTRKVGVNPTQNATWKRSKPCTKQSETPALQRRAVLLRSAPKRN